MDDIFKDKSILINKIFDLMMLISNKILMLICASVKANINDDKSTIMRPLTF